MRSVILVIFACVAFTCVSGCKKDSTTTDDSTALLGTWQNKEANAGAATGVSNVYVFNANGSYEQRSVIYDVASNLTLGFNYKATGKYAIKDNELTFSNVTYYTKTDYQAPYVPQDQLVAKQAAELPKSNFGFSAKRDSLSLAIQCPPNAFCVGLQWYKKQ